MNLVVLFTPISMCAVQTLTPDMTRSVARMSAGKNL